MKRAVIYARFSTDMQSEHSTRDQITNCTEFAKGRGWQILEAFEDAAISGSKRERPAYKRMMQAIKSGLVDVVIAEGLDRLNRSQEYSANLFSVCEFNDVEIHTIAEGRVEELHIGMKGTMDALQLKRIGQSTHRGLSGRVRDGKSAGGLSYGYRIPIDPATGLRQVGELEIGDEKASIIRRIFTDYAAGISPIAIAHQLNEEGIPAPRGGAWKSNTIYGNAVRGTGIINNELYQGIRVWNRLQYRKNPETDMRNSRERDDTEIQRFDMPELRIIDAELWDSVKARQSDQRNKMARHTPVKHRRQRYLLSGLLKCGCCGGNLTVAGAEDRRAYYCANAKSKGPAICKGMPGIRLDRLQPLVLSSLRGQLMTPEAVTQFRREFTARMADAERNRSDSETALRKALVREQKALDGCLRAIREDHATPSVYAMLHDAEQKKATLEAELAALATATPSISPDAAEIYRAKIDALAETLSDPSIVQHASEILSGLIDYITIAHEPNLGHTFRIEGKLLKLLSFAQNDKAADLTMAAGSLKMVAGVGFEPTTFRL